MLYLPVEVLRSIFNLLVQNDQLECMTVCQHWRDIIQGHSLFRTIFIYSYGQLNQILEKVKTNPILGEKVERLTIQDHLPLKNYSTKIIEHFPNLRDLALINLTDYKMGNKTIRPRPTHPWCKKMEKIVENLSDLNTKILLRSGPCKHLTYISVWGDNKPVRGLIEGMVSAPGLKTLHLRNYMVSFEDLELLHNVVPFLSSLLLERTKFIRCPHLLDIEPATSMKSVRCRHSSFRSFPTINPSVSGYSLLDNTNPHLAYFTQKYTHLEDLAVEIEMNKCSMDLWNRDTGMVASYIKELGPRLKTSSLKTIDFFTGYPIDIIDEIPKLFLCRIKKLDVIASCFDYVSKPTQVESIEALAVNKIDSSLQQCSMLLSSLRHFTMLKELTLNFASRSRDKKEHHLYLERLVDLLGDIQLETLCVYNGKLNLKNSLTNLVYPSLKELRLLNVTFAVGADILISRAFSNLKRLRLDNCFSEGDSFMLPSTDLSYLEVITTDLERKFAIMVISLADGQRRIYSAITQPSSFQSYRGDIEDDIFNLPPIYSKRYEEAKDIPMVSIVCNSVYDFFMANSETKFGNGL